MTPADFSTQLERLLPPARRDWLGRMRALAAARGWPLYVVGGFVRDVLLGLPPDDFDLVVEAAAPALARAAAEAWGGQVVVHAPFATATWTAPDGVAFDLASARTEHYPRPAALPVVHAPVSLAEDLRRRDFTINTLAVRLDGEAFGTLLDPFAGQADLAAGRVRVLHAASFVDDPTRLFRAVRYEQRLGFHLTPDTLALIPQAWPALAALTGDRVRREFELIFREAQAGRMLARLAELEVLRHAAPGLKWSGAETADAAELDALPWAAWGLAAPPDPTPAYWALLLRQAEPEALAAALARLRLPRAVADGVRDALALPTSWARPSEAVAALDPLEPPGWLAAYGARPSLRPHLHAYLTAWRQVRAHTTGADLIARGLTPGPAFKPLLQRLRAAWLDGEVVDADAEAALLARLLEAG